MTETNRPTTPAAEEILGLYFPVLDHGFVSLVDYMGSDDDVERAARVSLRLRHAQASATETAASSATCAGTSTPRRARWSS